MVRSHVVSCSYKRVNMVLGWSRVIHVLSRWCIPSGIEVLVGSGSDGGVAGPVSCYYTIGSGSLGLRLDNFCCLFFRV
ncbi:hypothetical protein HanPSC8_Chr01g0020221 [Helianthus annuus]|nr:hypothetical protein HanPSC8_Chr01g0020221 [Helianthus annuus]